MKYRVTLIVMVPAFVDVDVEAETPEEARDFALAEDAEEWQSSPRSRGMDYEIEWSERETPDINDVRPAPTRRVRA